MQFVDTPDDERLADYRHLKDVTARREGVVLAEGELVVRSLLRSALTVRSVFLTPTRFEALADALAEVAVPVYVAPLDVLRSVTGFDIHRGAIAAADRPASAVAAALLEGARRVVVLEGVNDAENLGSVFRNAAAFGCDAVLLSPTCADPMSRRAVRVSMGNALHVPWARLEPWPDGLGEVRRAGMSVVALTPGADAAPLARVASERVALLLGAEGPGLSPDALAAADRRARVPMAPGVDSLNVATAAAVALYELSRAA